jgi:hypothetical protein
MDFTSSENPFYDTRATSVPTSWLSSDSCMAYFPLPHNSSIQNRHETATYNIPRLFNQAQFNFQMQSHDWWDTINVTSAAPAQTSYKVGTTENDEFCSTDTTSMPPTLPPIPSSCTLQPTESPLSTRQAASSYAIPMLTGGMTMDFCAADPFCEYDAMSTDTLALNPANLPKKNIASYTYDRDPSDGYHPGLFQFENPSELVDMLASENDLPEARGPWKTKNDGNRFLLGLEQVPGG